MRTQGTASKGPLHSGGRPPHSALDTLQQRCWSANAAYRLGGIPYNYASGEHLSGHAIARRLEPEGFGARRESEGTYSRGDWRRYLQGQTVVSERRIARVEQLLPGTAPVFSLPLWRALHPRPWRTGESEGLLRASPFLTHTLYDVCNHEDHTFWRRRPVDGDLLVRLQEAGTAEAVSALAVLIREALAQGDRAAAFVRARALYAALIPACTIAPLCFVAEPLFDHLASGLLAACRTDRRWWHLTPRAFMAGVRYLGNILYWRFIPGWRVAVDEREWAGTLECYNQSLTGTHGAVLYWLYAPIRVDEDGTDRRHRHLAKALQTQAWARRNRYAHVPTRWPTVTALWLAQARALQAPNSSHSFP